MRGSLWLRVSTLTAASQWLTTRTTQSMADSKQESPPQDQGEEKERPADTGDSGDWGNAARWAVFGNRPNAHREKIEKDNREHAAEKPVQAADECG